MNDNNIYLIIHWVGTRPPSAFNCTSVRESPVGLYYSVTDVDGKVTNHIVRNFESANWRTVIHEQ